VIVLRRNFDTRGIDIVPVPTTDVEELVCVDLSAGQYYMHPGNAQRFKLEKPYKLKPGKCIVVETEEKLNVPDGVIGLLCSRGSLTERGLLVPNTKVDPFFGGHLDISIYNAGQRPIVIERGLRFCSIIFCHLEEETKSKHVRSAPPMHGDGLGTFRAFWEEHASAIIASITTIVLAILGAAVATYITIAHAHPSMDQHVPIPPAASQRK